jgi:branched-chain amino acid transport system substrate-binding protein
MTVRFRLAASALCLALLAASCDGGGAGTIRIGVLADCEGLFGAAGDPSYAGAELPLIRRGARPLGPKPSSGIRDAEVAGKRVQVVFGCADGTAEKTLSEARRLVERVGVDVLIGPTDEGEAFVVRDYARRRPQTTFLDGTAAGQSLTLDDPARNFYRFSTDGAQWSAGLGWYAYRKLGWRRAVTVADDSAFEYTQVAGFVAEFCAVGGTIVKRLWSPPGDVSAYLAENRADGFYVENPGNFMTGFKGLRGSLAKRIVGGIFWGSPGGTASPAILQRTVGVASGAPPPLGGTGAALSEYLAAMNNAFPDLDPVARLVFPIAYYDSMSAVLMALEQVHGDLSDRERRFQAALANIQLDSPAGPIRLDRNRQAVGPNLLSRFQRSRNGEVISRAIREVPNVDETFGGYFHTNGPPPSRTYPPCKHGNPPPWARSG